LSPAARAGGNRPPNGKKELKPFPCGRGSRAVRAYTGTALRQCGYQVLEASDGDEATAAPSAMRGNSFVAHRCGDAWYEWQRIIGTPEGKIPESESPLYLGLYGGRDRSPRGYFDLAWPSCKSRFVRRTGREDSGGIGQALNAASTVVSGLEYKAESRHPRLVTPTSFQGSYRGSGLLRSTHSSVAARNRTEPSLAKTNLATDGHGCTRRKTRPLSYPCASLSIRGQ